MPLLRHFEHLGHARFITFSTWQRIPYLSHPIARDLVVHHLIRMCQSYQTKLFGYCVMPDHIHMVLNLGINDTITLAMKSFKVASTMAIRSSIDLVEHITKLDAEHSVSQRRIWQHRGYDHNCRGETAMWEKIRYCHDNPVKAGLVTQASDWKWSSTTEYSDK